MKRAILFLFIIFGVSLYGKSSHELFTEILSQYVKDGKVNYDELRQDERLDKYIDQLSKTDPATIESGEDKLAFWINTYNAFTLKIVCDNYPVESIKDLNAGGSLSNALNKTVFDKDFIEINGAKMSLNHIENEIIRKKFDDPRIHFALVCAAVSCPPLRSEAYVGEKLDEQLNEQAKIFFSQKDKNYFEVEKKVAHLSKLLDWYSGDFGESDKEKLLFVSRFLPEETASAIKKNPGEWQIQYTDYNWALNEL